VVLAASDGSLMSCWFWLIRRAGYTFRNEVRFPAGCRGTCNRRRALI